MPKLPEVQRPAAPTPIYEPFDPNKHKPRPNKDGSVSTELEATEYAPEGRVWNIPMLWFSQDGRPVELTDPRQAAALAYEYERITGKKFPRFRNISEGVNASKARSRSGGGTQGSMAK